MKHIRGRILQALLVLILALSLQLALPTSASAAAASCSKTATVGDTQETCTDFKCLQDQAYSGDPGILTSIMTKIKEIVGDSSQKLYTQFLKSSSYQNAVNAAVTLMIIIYGIAFMIGLVQANFGQALLKLIKIGFVYTLINPDYGWAFFNEYIVTFFNDGTDELIRTVIGIGTGTPVVAGASPFIQLDGLAKWVLSPDMIIAILSLTFASGPYGFVMGGLMAFALGGVIKLVLEALKVYGIAFIMRSLLLGIAPIFLVFLLFDRTKSLFTSWLNTLVSLSLHPILFFTFLSFFFTMIMTSAVNMLGVSGATTDPVTGKTQPIEFCWTEGGGVSGTQNKVSYWRMKIPGHNSALSDGFDWKGPISCMLGGDASKCKFPINVIDILSFLILVYIGQRFADVTARLASEIANAFVNLDTQSRFDLGQNKAADKGETTGKVGAAGQSPRTAGPSAAPSGAGDVNPRLRR